MLRDTRSGATFHIRCGAKRNIFFRHRLRERRLRKELEKAAELQAHAATAHAARAIGENANYPAIPGKAFERKWERLVRKIKAKGGAYSPWAVATATLKGYPASRAAKNPLTERQKESLDLFFDDPAAWVKKYPRDARRFAKELRASGFEYPPRRRGKKKNPSRRAARRMRVLRSHARSFGQRHRRAAKFARKGGRFAAGFAKGAFPEAYRAGAGLKAGYEAARKNPAQASRFYLSLAQKYLSQGAFRSAEDAIQRAKLAASPGSMEEIEAERMDGRLKQALLDRTPGGMGRMWARLGKNPKVQGAELVEIIYREKPSGQLWRHTSGEVTGVPRRLKVTKGKSSDTVSFKTKVTGRGIID